MARFSAVLAIGLALAVALTGCTSPSPPGDGTNPGTTPPTTPPSMPPTTPPGTPPGTPTSPPTGAPRVVTFTATDYNFTGPTSTAGGWVTLELRNQGREPHEMALMGLDNHTFLDFVTAFRQSMAPNGSMPAWIHHAGGVGAVNPGATGRVTQNLAPGTYALVCFVPDPQGVPHAVHGMVLAFNVTAASGAAPAVPQADLRVDMLDFNFTQQPDPPMAGNRTVHVRNVGQEPHQTQVFRLQGNFTTQQLLAFFGEGPAGNDTNQSAPPRTGPPPFSLEGGLAPIEAGGEGYFPLDLQPGRYVYICFVDGHFMRGMTKEFTVAA